MSKRENLWVLITPGVDGTVEGDFFVVIGDDVTCKYGGKLYEGVLRTFDDDGVLSTGEVFWTSDKSDPTPFRINLGIELRLNDDSKIETLWSPSC